MMAIFHEDDQSFHLIAVQKDYFLWHSTHFFLRGNVPSIGQDKAAKLVEILYGPLPTLRWLEQRKCKLIVTNRSDSQYMHSDI